MIQGRFDIRSFDTPGLTPAKLDELIGPRSERRPGAMDKLLKEWTPVQEAGGNNLIFDSFPAFINYWLLQEQLTKLDISDWLDTDAGNAYFATISWETLTSEPTYQEFASGFNIQPASMSNIVASGAWRRFIEDDVEPHLITSDPNGREAINFRSRWLWYPSSFTSSNINSIAAWHSHDADGDYAHRNRGARIRLKNAAGNPITISKNANQSLFAEYNVTIVSV